LVLKPTDFLKVKECAAKCKPLEDYDSHIYKILLKYFDNTCFTAEHNGEVAGFVISFMSQTSKDTCFLWQIGVDPAFQGKGIATDLLKKFEKHLKELGCKRIELTIDPENIASQKLFEKNGYKNASSNEGETIEVKGKVSVKDYYKPGRHFMLYEKYI